MTRLIFALLFLWSVQAEAFTEISGQLRTQGLTAYRDSDDILTINNDQSQFFLDGGLDGRINLEHTHSDSLFLGVSYEAVISGGQTRKAINTLPVSGSLLFPSYAYPDDSTQLFSLTGVLADEDEYLAYHRLDRLYLELRSDVGDLALGRQALTWGNGLVFNPADLVNPFAPADIIRDYKIGSDMLLYRYSGETITGLQLVYVPRRDSTTGEVSIDASTFGGKLSYSHQSRDINLYGLRHYSDSVLGSGVNVFLGEALVRSDVLVTIPEQTSAYLSAVANVDYSWIWADHNWYGMLEFYYNGLGKDNYLDALQDPELSERLLRGDLFVTGRFYLTGLLRYEAHPLVNISGSMILNLEDGSFLLQPRIDWSVSQALHLLAGLNLAVGRQGSEYGQIELPSTESTAGRGQQLYLILTWYL